MNPAHHLDDATLLSYSAGSLPPALSWVATTHLSLCAHCRARLRAADSVGGQLLEATPAAAPSAESRAAMLALLDALPADTAKPKARPVAAPAAAPAPAVDADVLPVCLQPLFGERYSELRWRFVAPGIKQIRPPGFADGKLMLLKIAPGFTLPIHGHGNNELTLVLKGAYNDDLGRFAAGDIADLDSETEHQPIAERAEPCISLAATDAPLRFKSVWARMLQPFVGV